MIERGDRVFCCVSGGKDSTACLIALKEYMEKKGVDAELKAFHLILGEEGYRHVKELCSLLDVELVSFSPEIDIQKVARKLRRPICSVCGTVKRYYFNKIPREFGATKVATGHNADDFIMFIFKNFISGNVEYSLKFLPVVRSSEEKLVTKIRPLFFISSKESEAICKQYGVETLDFQCPFLGRECKSTEFYEKWFKMINCMENNIGSFREGFLTGFLKLLSLVEKKEEKYNYCSICGEPCKGEICSFCRLTKQNVP